MNSSILTPVSWLDLCEVGEYLLQAVFASRTLPGEFVASKETACESAILIAYLFFMHGVDFWDVRCWRGNRVASHAVPRRNGTVDACKWLGALVGFGLLRFPINVWVQRQVGPLPSFWLRDESTGKVADMSVFVFILPPTAAKTSTGRPCAVQRWPRRQYGDIGLPARQRRDEALRPNKGVVGPPHRPHSTLRYKRHNCTAYCYRLVALTFRGC